MRCVFICVPMCFCGCLCVCVCVCVCLYMCTYMCVCGHMHACMEDEGFRNLEVKYKWKEQAGTELCRVQHN